MYINPECIQSCQCEKEERIYHFESPSRAVMEIMPREHLRCFSIVSKVRGLCLSLITKWYKNVHSTVLDSMLLNSFFVWNMAAKTANSRNFVVT